METRFLKTVLEVADAGSIAAAARRLNVTPSAIVQRIKAVEAELGQDLFQRSGQHMRPTEAAITIMDLVKRLLAAEDDLKAAAALDEPAGLLRLGAIQSALTGILPDLLTRLRERQPGIELYIKPGTSGELYEAVISNDIDVAIVVRPQFHLPKALTWRSLRDEQMLLIAHPSASQADPLELLRREPFIRYDRNHWGGALVEQFLRTRRLAVRECYELDSLEAITVLVSRNLGVALVPDWLPPWPAGSDVSRHVLADGPNRQLGLLWRTTSMRRRLVEALAKETIGVFAADLVPPEAARQALFGGFDHERGEDPDGRPRCGQRPASRRR